MTQKLAIFGATGSIGTNTLRVLEANPDACQLVAISGHSRLARLAGLARRWQPQWVLISREHNKTDAELFVGYNGELVWGEQALAEFAATAACDSLLLAISGSAALPAAYAAASSGKRLLLANKEALVAAGELMVNAARASGAQLVPVDSEHNAIWQCLAMPKLPGTLDASVASLEITASGGPFWQWSEAQMRNASIAQACAHPNWKMGSKISIDSATMVNKALELIEARWLFGIAPQHLRVSIHPQSLVHGMVHFANGSSLVQMSQPDMRVAIATALFGEQGRSSGVGGISLQDYRQLDFFPPDNTRFVALPLVHRAMQAGEDRCLCFDISNERANLAFRQGRIGFGQIVECIVRTLNASQQQALSSIEQLHQRQIELAGQADKAIAELEQK